MKISVLSLTAITLALPTLSYANSSFFEKIFKEGDGFKRFSVSAGWLYSKPTGGLNPVQVNTAVNKGRYETGPVQATTVRNMIANTPEGAQARDHLDRFIEVAGNRFPNGTIPATVSGYTQINSLDDWTSQNTGLKAQEVNTLGLLMNYHITDNWSIQMKGGLPPKVDIAGTGQVFAPLKGLAIPEGRAADSLVNSMVNTAGHIPLDKNISVTNLAQSKTAATARAWLPATEIQYQFGKTGINKFRPYVGVGIIYAHFTDVKLDKGIEKDLIAAGHMIYLTKHNQAGAAIENKTSHANPVVNVKATDAVAPIVTLGATYDINENFYAVASVSYAKMHNKSIITVTDKNTGEYLHRSTTRIDINPLITYMGIGYRF